MKFLLALDIRDENFIYFFFNTRAFFLWRYSFMSLFLIDTECDKSLSFYEKRRHKVLRKGFSASLVTPFPCCINQYLWEQGLQPSFSTSHWGPESKWQRHPLCLHCFISGKQRTLWDCLLEKAKEHNTSWHWHFGWDANSTQLWKCKSLTNVVKTSFSSDRSYLGMKFEDHDYQLCLSQQMPVIQLKSHSA